MRTSTQLLGKRHDFERESYLEGYISSNPIILSPIKNAPDDMLPVYIIGRQEICKIVKGDKKRGITDLICLIWDDEIYKFQIWIYELKTKSINTKDVQQIQDYLTNINQPVNAELKEDIVKRAKKWVVNDEYLEISKIRGALCSQDFSDEVLGKIITENRSRGSGEKILAIRIQRFPVGKEVFVLVEPVIGDNKSKEKSSGLWHVNVGEVTGEDRNWEDCRNFGFLSAGQGPYYRDAISRLPIGTPIFAYLNKSGYVGYGIIKSAAKPFREFTFNYNSQYKGRTLLEILPELNNQWIKKNMEDYDFCEYIIEIEWKVTKNREEGLKPNIIMRGTVNPIKNQELIDFLIRNFEINN